MERPKHTILLEIVPDGLDGEPEGIILRDLRDLRDEHGHKFVTHHARRMPGAEHLSYEGGNYFERGDEAEDLKRAVADFINRRARFLCRHARDVALRA